ncbi:MAG: VOC family protein [Gaiellaceae bacterium]
MTSLREGFPIVYVRDMRAALAFYCDLLGFAETYRNPPGSETPAFVSLKLDETTKLALAEHGVPEQMLGQRPGEGIRFELWLYADDVDAEVERLRAHGVPVLRQPESMPWGERLAYVEDPDGNPIAIGAGQ